MTQLKLLMFGLGLVVCAACQAVDVSPSALPGSSPTVPPPTPTPPIQVVSHHLISGIAPDEWRVVGLIENQGDTIVGQIDLSVTLLDASGAPIARTSTRAILSNLFPGESGPFSASFKVDGLPAEAQVEPLAHEEADAPPSDGRLVDSQRPELVAELKEFFLTGNGELAALGFVTNPGPDRISLESLAFLGQNPNGEAKLVAVMQFGPSRISPGETVPILVLAPENPGAIRWTPFHDGVIAEGSADVQGTDTMEILGDPQLHLTAQGAPFVVGTLSNSGDSAAVGSVLVSLHDGNRLIGLWEIDTPRPLLPGEQLAFTAFGFPGISLRFNASDPSTVRVETRVEARAASEASVPVILSVDVSAFHSVGSAIFLRGSIRNPTRDDVEGATVYAEVRSSMGELVTAGWSEAQTLEPNGSAEFVLDLPIPVALDAALAEYDLRAIGLKAEP
ncbi:MAG: FxLYD domain-containing protein [Anaerolineales bacterium]